MHQNLFHLSWCSQGQCSPLPLDNVKTPRLAGRMCHGRILGQRYIALVVGYFRLYRKYTAKGQLLLVRKYMELFSLEDTYKEGTFWIFVINYSQGISSITQLPIHPPTFYAITMHVDGGF